MLQHHCFINYEFHAKCQKIASFIAKVINICISLSACIFIQLHNNLQIKLEL